MATKKTFNHQLGDTVVLSPGSERGTVIGRAHFTDANPSYQVRYVAGDGRLTEQWWGESAVAPADPASAPRPSDG